MTAQADADTLLSRRAFLKQGGALVVTFALTAPPIHAEAARPADKSVAADEVGGFIAIDAKGKVTIYSGKVELGTGALTAIAQIAAEELSVPLDRVTMIQGDTAADAQPGADLRQPVDPGRRHADPARCGHRARGAPRSGLQTSSRWRRTALTARDGVVTSRTGGEQAFVSRNWSASNSLRSKSTPRRR